MDKGAAAYERFLQGDEKALDDLVKLYRSPLTNFIKGYVCDYDTAEDIMIDVFVELLQKKKRFKGNSDFKTYLFAIGRNKAYKHMRKHSRESFVSIDEVAEYLSLENNSLENEFIIKSQKEELSKAICELKPEYRDVIYLMYYQNMSYDEIAKVMKKNTKQVSNLAHRARLALKEKIEKGSVDIA